ncbi:efflux RND transporter periplasmic adaptor subunit [Halioxenophilus sp. WMMB6]|uniref:efflux RND transporter periplasmic adaptor subunit n=1 Tax=Halioxenophilus sp. WMMB6 TaxID=3073815 RepID=UPI00295EC764|nr:efflux RND transporter periplasmic adaptor subunit [Halioxenophilus sp. WMMB6]
MFTNIAQRARPITKATALASLLAACLAVVGCGEKSAVAATQPPAAVVKVKTVALAPVADWSVFTGEFRSVEAVQLRPRVNGYLQQVSFTEGSLVQAGDILFVIDQQPYKVALQRADAELARAEAQLQLANSESARGERLIKAQAISEEEYGRRLAQKRSAEADYQAAQAAREEADLNLHYTEVRAPITGRVSLANITAGNYVNAGSTVLTTIVSSNPMYVVFDTDEQSYIDYVNGLAQWAEDHPVAPQVLVGLAGTEAFPFSATLDFIDNQLNASSGTIRVRALIDNSNGQFLPGMAARIRMQLSDAYPAALVNEAVIGTDQSRKYVLVVNDSNVVEYRAVQLGGIYQGLRVIRSGLNEGDRLIVAAGPRIRPGVTVQPQTVEATTAALDPVQVSQSF